jgi:hypothetical protein
LRVGTWEAGTASDNWICTGPLDNGETVEITFSVTGPEAGGNVADLGFARRVLDHGRAMRERSRHQRRVGAADGHLGEDDLAALEAVLGAGDDVAAVDLDLGAEAFERHDQEIDRPGADGAAARQRDLGLMHPRQQRRDHPEAGAHLRHQFVGRCGVDDVGRRNVQGLALILAVARPLAH